MKLQIQALTKETKELYEGHTHKHEGDSGIDLFFPEDMKLWYGDREHVYANEGKTFLIGLGVKCRMLDENGIPVSYMLIPRSSISKTPLRMANPFGLIDAGYRGEIKVAVDLISYNHSVSRGDRLFQIVAPDLSPITVELVDTLDETGRGEGGFGSTGA